MSDLQRWLVWNESQTFERKSCYEGPPATRTRRPPDDVALDIAETLCAMANADGGVVLVGQENRRVDGEDAPGEVTGVDYRPQSLALLREVPVRLLVPSLDDADVREERHDNLRVLVFRVRASPLAHRLTNGRCLLRIGTHNVPYDQHVVSQLKQAQSPYE